jgi:hypothetical protein
MGLYDVQFEAVANLAIDLFFETLEFSTLFSFAPRFSGSINYTFCYPVVQGAFTRTIEQDGTKLAEIATSGRLHHHRN